MAITVEVHITEVLTPAEIKRLAEEVVRKKLMDLTAQTKGN